MNSSITALIRLATFALAGLFLLMLLRPEIFVRSGPVVEIQQSEDHPIGMGPASYADAVSRAAPAVVNINTAKVVTERRISLFDDPIFRHFFGEQLQVVPRKRLETSLGSGVIVSKEGYILTNNHVIDGADEIQISLHDGRTSKARLIGSDPDTDLALLQVKMDALPAITFGQSKPLRVGDVTLAIGNPFGVGQTVTMGIISATNRSQLGISNQENFIQTDAAINPGNSGGALIDAHGNLIGVNTAIFSKTGASHGIGFAIPVATAQHVMQQLIEHGKVLRGWIGVEMQNLTPELANSFGVATTHGAIVAGIYRDGPAAKAGLTPGDIITHVEGKAIQSGEEIAHHALNQPIGSILKLSGTHNGKAASWHVTIQPKQ
ncbi:MAG: trypsin-like serine protease [Gammaproteobacteria bacterium]|jgi:Do/DeqQ family serine protease|nr:trypsin-like serine protease [Gammaproteobacteria bacterium]MBT3490122.1 trypsin-like serine protease [Gammaproteobacteria bacterium]MBT3717299.1 trypsin-like serine protease [Gammaproteobacteria bacterium]MBT3844590.1 trypsin-like serine protease [Gammaproteobacteria bacterium]MBT3891898.1 trypsin-like serine protease [Gammaproteobacteria bacterium]